MQIEELVEYKNWVITKATSMKKDLEKMNFNRAKDDGCRDPPNEPRYTLYTLPNTSRVRLLEQALATKILAMLKRANTLPREDFFKQC